MLQKFEMIRQYLFENDEETNVDRFDMAWDINEYFWKLVRHVKLGMVENLTKALTESLGADWDVVSNVSEEYWSKGVAGVFISKKQWGAPPDNIQLGILAQAQEFNRLCLCMKVPHPVYPSIVEKIGPDFLEQQTLSHTIGYTWLTDPFYGEANTKDFHKRLLTVQGLSKTLSYYTSVLMEFKDQHEALLDEAAKQMVLQQVVK